jgi:hypothetical protein
MITGTLLAESLRVGATIEVPGLRIRSLRREDVSASTTGTQPNVWTLIEFEAPPEAADALTETFKETLLAEGGWYADFRAGDEHVVVFAGKAFRYPVGDEAGRAAAQEYGRSVGVPEHQLDWGA